MQVTGNNSLNTYRLSIRVFTDGFSLFTYTNTQTKPFSEEFFPVADQTQLPAQLEAILSRPHITGHIYEKVEVLACTPTTHIPLDEFRREEMVPLYRLTFSNMECASEDVQYEILKSLEVVELYYLPAEVRNAISHVYPEAEFHAMHGQILERLSGKKTEREEVDGICHVQVVRDNLYVSVLEPQGLRFACDYRAATDNNRFYYILYALKTLETDLKRTLCLLSGVSDTLKENLEKYILFVEPCV